jgi:hypothetical protein
VAYLVIEKCAGSCGHYDDEIYSGSVFRVYTKSYLLEHFSQDTGGPAETILHRVTVAKLLFPHTHPNFNAFRRTHSSSCLPSP